MQLSRVFDNFIGKIFSIEQVGFISTSEPWKANNKTMSENEWKDYRKCEINNSSPPITNWLTLLANKESRKFHIFESIKNLCLKNNYKKVLELSCGQGHVISLLNFAGFETEATELDPSTILVSNLTEQIPITIKQSTFEAINEEFLEKFDLCYLVQVDYIFNTEALLNFLSKAKRANTTILFVNTQVLGPLRGLKNKIQFKQRTHDSNLKEHGFLRSLGQYKSICKQLNATCTIIPRNEKDDSSYYILIEF